MVIFKFEIDRGQRFLGFCPPSILKRLPEYFSAKNLIPGLPVLMSTICHIKPRLIRSLSLAFLRLVNERFKLGEGNQALRRLQSIGRLSFAIKAHNALKRSK